MPRSILDLAGYSADDPAVVAAQRDNNQLTDLIERLVACRRANDLTQNDVAERMSTSQSVVSDIERILGNPKFLTLSRYARAIDCELAVSVVPAKESGGWHHLKFAEASGARSAYFGHFFTDRQVKTVVETSDTPYYDVAKTRASFALAS